ncbi:acyltransferase family protein [Ornithinimicrobium sp. F0845]|uniref:acyltransferase family protein n=1 Tax=Ornithinimicrobium sp. F0845 TaxID=2926412 RepID=UPI001FF1A403|nr:acyltransferase family protein [Ornithinimicrobium sp. F0845]MCK0113442.1 acyltransferase family protein [Ornithinimicrobium sp. F0845]
MSAQTNEPESPPATSADPPGTSTARHGPAAGTDLLERPVAPARTALPEATPDLPRRRRRGPSDLDPRPGHIHGLDGIRALAIIGVLIFHFTPTVLPGGFLGVDVFFVLSGFLITTLLLREISRRGRLNLPQFWLRRARRLLPALVTVVVVSIAAARLAGGDLLVNIGRQTLGAMTFSTNWVEVAAGASYFDSTSPLLFVNFWSLAVEEQFYLLWPLALVVVLAVTRTSRQRIGIALGLALGSALLMAVLFSPGQDSTRVYYGTDTHLFGLMLGVALAFAWAAPHRLGLHTRAWRRWRMPAVLTALVVLVVLMSRLTDAHPWTYRGGILLACVATAVLIAGLLESPSGWRRAMELRPLSYLGERSYGIYLWHWPVLMIVAALFPYAEGTLRGYVTLTAALVLTLVLSELCFRYVETPVRTHGFRACYAAVRERVSGPTRGAVTSAVAAITVLAVALAGVAIATAPEKSETQLAIEAAEADLNTAPVDAPARVSLAGGALLGTTSVEDTGVEDTGVEDAAIGGGAVDGAGDAGSGESVGTLGEGFQSAMDRIIARPGGDGTGSGSADDPDAADPGVGQETDPAEQTGDPAEQPAEVAVPEGWHEDEEGLLVPNSSRLTAIGDSLVVTSADGLKWRFPEMNFAAKSNRQWKDANPVLEAALAEGTVRDNVIVHFGTNAGVNEKQLRQFLDTLGPDRNVVVMNLYGSSTFTPSSNETIEEVVADYPNAVVGDWQGTIEQQPEVLQSDRIHPDIEGMHVYAGVVARAFDELARRG